MREVPPVQLRSIFDFSAKGQLHWAHRSAL